MKKDKIKRISAIIGIAAILSLYLTSLLLAIFASDKAPGLFLASVFCTVIIPIIIYCFIAVYDYVHKKAEPQYYTENDATDAENDQTTAKIEDTVTGNDVTEAVNKEISGDNES